LSLLVTGGTISNLLVEVAGLDLYEALQLLGTRDRQIELRCAIADFRLKDGVAQSEAVVIDTVDTIVTMNGNINFKNETLALKAFPEPKDKSPFVLRSPMLVDGSFRDPNVHPQWGSIAARAAAGGLLAMVNPLLALLPFIETGPGKDSNCGQLINERVRPAGQQRAEPAIKDPRARVSGAANPQQANAPTPAKEKEPAKRGSLAANAAQAD
jgi:uncharacterized protein involved in outer membrane biogenesis